MPTTLHQSRSMKRQNLIQHIDSAPSSKPLRRVTFDSLPVELQDEIFFFCTLPFPRFSIKEAPIVLARVCRRWRSMVLSTPRLWSSFQVEVEGSGASGLLHDARLMRRMKLWLERSGGCPLSVRLVYNPVGNVSDNRSMQLLVALIPQARRWRSVHFTLPSESILKLQDLPPNSFPILQSLTLQVTAVRSSPSEPLLNILTMKIPWRQLTDLNLQFELISLPTLDEAFDILSKTVNLKRGTLQLECTWKRRGTRREILSLPALDTLQLTFQTARAAADQSGDCLVQFLNLLSIPKLRTLSLGWLAGAIQTWSLVHTDFLAFLQASANTLRELTMTYFPISENQLLECFSQVPQLTHLDLRFALREGANDPITNQLLVACTIPVPTGSACSTPARAETPLLPRLEHLNLHCHGALYESAALFSFIQSRWHLGKRIEGQDSPRSLRYFRLLSMRSVPSEVEKNVKVWHEEGLDIDIQSLFVR